MSINFLLSNGKIIIKENNIYIYIGKDEVVIKGFF